MKLGILGGGQLARMLSLAAHPLGIQSLCYATTAHNCADDVADIIVGDYTDHDQLATFLAQVDYVTYENENIPSQTADYIQQTHSLNPNQRILTITQDRLLEKQLFNELNIPTPAFTEINSATDLEHTLFDTPAVLKTRRFGYDGKGQYIIRKQDEISQAWATMQQQPAILEAFVDFHTEVSILGARDQHDTISFYPLVNNTHQHGILYTSTAPYHNPILQQQAEHYAIQIMRHFDYVGVLAIEFFLIGDDLLANEIAPRVHNSGHWTIEGAHTSQFENHVRAICNLPLGNTSAKGYSALFNCIGTLPDIKQLLRHPYVHYHDYHKTAQPGRKLGHITLNCSNQDDFEVYYAKLQHIVSEDNHG